MQTLSLSYTVNDERKCALQIQCLQLFAVTQ
jgi:hypothetical protein